MKSPRAAVFKASPKKETLFRDDKNIDTALPSNPHPDMSLAPISLRQSLIIWLAGTMVYVVAVAGRLSFGMAGIEAANRFGATASELSLFVVVQIGVYALVQIPIGILNDRLGSRFVLVLGALVLAAGQVCMAIAPAYGWALLARVLIGFGDATAFLSVLRLLPLWFPPRLNPLFTQLTNVIGALGQIIAALPFAYVLTNYGWTAAFGALAMIGLVVALLALALVINRPSSEQAQIILTYKKVKASKKPAKRIDFNWRLEELQARSPWKEPAVWLGFFSHTITFTPWVVFAMMWGVPLMRLGFHYSEQDCSLVMMVISISSIGTAILIGHLTAAHPLRRTWPIVTSFLLVTGGTVYILYGPRPNLFVISIYVSFLSLGASASSVGFDFVRTGLHQRYFGYGSGIVNGAGFITGLLSVQLMGIIFDFKNPQGDYDLGDFQAAFFALFIVQALSLVGFAISYHYAKRSIDRRGITIPTLKEVLDRELERKRQNWKNSNRG